jgi:predicted nucleic acid-binding Zn ribbon protein
MTEKRPKAKFVHIGSVIDTVLNTYRRDADSSLVKVWQTWDSVVGDVVAQNARPAAFKGRTLLVHVASSTWIHQLQFLKTEIMDKLNQALDRQLVQDLKFKIGPIEIE